jgi:hypothetical protein
MAPVTRQQTLKLLQGVNRAYYKVVVAMQIFLCQRFRQDSYFLERREFCLDASVLYRVYRSVAVFLARFSLAKTCGILPVLWNIALSDIDRHRVDLEAAYRENDIWDEPDEEADEDDLDPLIREIERAVLNDCDEAFQDEEMMEVSSLAEEGLYVPEWSEDARDEYERCFNAVRWQDFMTRIWSFYV